MDVTIFDIKLYKRLEEGIRHEKKLKGILESIDQLHKDYVTIETLYQNVIKTNDRLRKDLSKTNTNKKLD
jgi:cell fate (sporulation/competence/biofilm development) regulator YmcA (YheA/YmcA/DUF963 family)